MKNQEYIDLGLPSGTLWATKNEDGYFSFDEAVEQFESNLPTREQFQELNDYCKWEWEDNGMRVIGKNGNSVFFPAKGYREDGKTNHVGLYGNYWSSVYDTSYYAYSLHFYSSNVFPQYVIFRSYEFSVRLVKSK